MIILDKPYVSDLLVDTINELKIPVLENKAINDLELHDRVATIINEQQFINEYRTADNQILYCNSENPINWITTYLACSNLPQMIDLFKDKAKFRRMTKNMYPNLFYQELLFEEIQSLDVSNYQFPFVIKPSVGFFSLGVYTVFNRVDWENVKKNLLDEAVKMGERFPREVVNANKFIIEGYIEGDEYAIDAYYDEEGKPVILNILQHVFSSDADVSDRMYLTSKEIIEKHLQSFTNFLEKIGEVIIGYNQKNQRANHINNKQGNNLAIKNFPVHVEVRVDAKGNIVPIEVNPMRFAGWCTTDIAYYAYGINVYEYFFGQKTPNWQQLLNDKHDKIYSMIIADLPKDINIDAIKSVDYQKLLADFEKPLAIREIDYKKHGVTAFLFAETKKENYKELEAILTSDLKEYLIIR